MCRLPFGQLISIGRGSSFISSPRCSERDSFSSRFPPDQWTTDRDKHSLRTLCSLVRPFISICPRPKSKEGFIFLSFPTKIIIIIIIAAVRTLPVDQHPSGAPAYPHSRNTHTHTHTELTAAVSSRDATLTICALSLFSWWWERRRRNTQKLDINAATW